MDRGVAHQITPTAVVEELVPKVMSLAEVQQILQMLLLQPRLAVLDETDSGLDIDALQVVAQGVNSFRTADNGVLMITHYQRLLSHIVPDVVHVLADGRIVRSGGKELALELEEKGYRWLTA